MSNLFHDRRIRALVPPTQGRAMISWLPTATSRHAIMRNSVVAAARDPAWNYDSKRTVAAPEVSALKVNNLVTTPNATSISSSKVSLRLLTVFLVFFFLFLFQRYITVWTTTTSSLTRECPPAPASKNSKTFCLSVRLFPLQFLERWEEFFTVYNFFSKGLSVLYCTESVNSQFFRGVQKSWPGHR